MISIIMPIYNGEKFLEEAVGSVCVQTVQDWELLIIDDCSADGSYALAQHLAREDQRIILLKNETNLGVADTRNRGISASRGEYIAFLDCDDVWLPKKLERQLSLLAQADVVYNSYQLIYEDGRKHSVYHVPNQVDFEMLLKENVIGCSTVMLRKELLQGTGFCRNFYHEDYVLWLELLQRGARFCGTEEVLSCYRLRSDSKTGDKWRSATERWRVYRVYLRFSLFKSLKYWLFYALSGRRKYKSEGGDEDDRTSANDAGDAERN